MKTLLPFLVCNLLFYSLTGQIPSNSSYCNLPIDSFLAANKKNPFNGVLIISKGNSYQYARVMGYADFKSKKLLRVNDPFVIGSISKQITAVLVLLEVEKGKLDLHTPIYKYLPHLKQPWADSVTIHHLLTHMDGIISLEQPLAFSPGTQYRYNQINFDLMAKILESVSNTSFAKLSQQLFSKIGMNHSFHPDMYKNRKPVNGYLQKGNKFVWVKDQHKEIYVAAGGFISTAGDLILWNNALHNGKIVAKHLYDRMIAKQEGAVRNHPIFGLTEYGYGITVDTKENIVQLGQTGYAEGFTSLNFYFPTTKTSVIVLENLVKSPGDLADSFFDHLSIWKMVRCCQKK